MDMLRMTEREMEELGYGLYAVLSDGMCCKLFLAIPARLSAHPSRSKIEGKIRWNSLPVLGGGEMKLFPPGNIFHQHPREKSSIRTNLPTM